jgi:hypothetical protein
MAKSLKWIELHYVIMPFLFYGLDFINCHTSRLALYGIMGLDVKVCSLLCTVGVYFVGLYELIYFILL